MAEAVQAEEAEEGGRDACEVDLLKLHKYLAVMSSARPLIERGMSSRRSKRSKRKAQQAQKVHEESEVEAVEAAELKTVEAAWLG